MNKIGYYGLVGLTLATISVSCGCQNFMAEVVRKALASDESSRSLIDTEYNPIVRNGAYQMLKECEEERKSGKIESRVMYYDKKETAIEFLIEMNDPNVFQIITEYFDENRKAGVRLMKMHLEKKGEFKNKENSKD